MSKFVLIFLAALATCVVALPQFGQQAGFGATQGVSRDIQFSEHDRSFAQQGGFQQAGYPQGGFQQGGFQQGGYPQGGYQQGYERGYGNEHHHGHHGHHGHHRGY